MNILVPTDFSEMAEAAVRYAAMLAKKMGAKITLFHALPHHSVWWSITNEELAQEAREKQHTIKKELVRYGVKQDRIETVVFYQFPLNRWINDYVRKNKINFAVIGTKGATGLKKARFGSFALGMIEHLSIPVIAVPPEADVSGIRNILYPTDMLDTAKELKKLLPYAQAFDANIHIIHISKNELSDKVKTANKLNEIKNRSGYEKITTDVKSGESIESLIGRSIKETNASLLVMFTKKEGFFLQLFKSSVTEKTSHRLTIPLFAIKK